MIPFFILLAVVLLAGVFVAGIYNRLVTLQNRYENAYSQIDVQLKRRYDLIPNLVETARGYLTHERETLREVISARNQAMQANRKAALRPGEAEAMEQLAGTESLLAGALDRLMMVAEDYPDLQANKTMHALMEGLRSTEDRVAFARQAYNDAVIRYNTKRETFPDTLAAATFAFREAQPFEVLDTDTEVREAPEVSFA